MRSLLLLLLLPVFVSAQNGPYVFKSNLYYKKLEASGDGMFGFEKDGKFGYIDKNEKVVIPAIYSYESSYSSEIPSFNNGYVKIKKDSKYGALDKTGKMAIPFDYESLYFLFNGIAASVSIKKDGKFVYGIVNMQNKVVVPIEYEQFQVNNDLLGFKQNGKWGLMDITGKKILPAEYDQLVPYADDKVVQAKKGSQYGYIDLTGKWLFEKAASVYTLYGSHYGMITCVVNSKYGYLDRQGNEAVITRYDNADGFESNGLAKVSKRKNSSSYYYQSGYIDKKGKEVIPVIYDSIGTFSNGLVYAKDPETNRYGYMDKTGAWILKPVYLKAEDFDESGGAWVRMTDGKFHYINKMGKDFGAVDDKDYKGFGKDGYSIIENNDYPFALVDKTGNMVKKLADCDAIYTFSDGIAGYRCKSNSKYGFIDYTGKKIGACSYDGFSGFVDGIARVEMKVDGKTKYGYINTKGETVLAAEYDDLRIFRDGWGIMKKDDSYFFVDKNGKTQEPPRKYDNLWEFRSGYAVGILNGADKSLNTYYYINTSLKEEFNIKAYQGYQFWENVAVVNMDSVYSLMNKKGEVFKRLVGVDQMKFCSDGTLAVREDGKWGYIDDRGNKVIETKYDSCDVFKNGFGRFKMNGKWGLVDKSGKEIVKAEYENVYSGDNGVFIFYDGGWGIMDKTGKITVQPKLYSITAFEKDKALARFGKSFTILRSPLAK